ncbi:hypothetical protein [Mycolicibacterium sp. P9-64]|uniref:hypothetical protein n=1 Tax=Mycolicibacterium sp. P9-64 TaxID=2024612 RepID=UPI00156668CB|nr:hypothetical protein [Mycolicibacterium sp. P9-64]
MPIVFGVLVISATWAISYAAILGGDMKIPLAYTLTIAAGITAMTARVAIARNRVPLHLFMGDPLSSKTEIFDITVNRCA